MTRRSRGTARGWRRRRGVGGLLAVVCALAGCRREGAIRYGSAPQGAPMGQVAAPGAIDRADVVPVAWAGRSRRTEPSYPLDSFGRTLSSGQLSCPAVDARDFAGTSLRFSPAAKVIEPFRQKLVAFEQVVREVSERVYGRWPSAILVAASYGCRSVGGANRKLSEHALGNAIDITGFEFAPLGFVPPAWSPAPLTALLSGFQVRVDRHWKATGDTDAVRHAYFLDQLTRTLIERDVFRTLLGPAHPDHHDHFHFDMAPWNYVHL